MTRARIRAVAATSGLSRARAYAPRRRSSSGSIASIACMSSSIRLARRSSRPATGRLAIELRRVDPELAAKRRDRPELQPPDRSFLLAHRLGCLASREAREEPQRDGVSLLVRQSGECRTDGVELLADHRDLVGAGVAVGETRDCLEAGVVVSGSGVIDDSIPGQPEEPAPEGNAARL